MVGSKYSSAMDFPTNGSKTVRADLISSWHSESSRNVRNDIDLEALYLFKHFKILTINDTWKKTNGIYNC